MINDYKILKSKLVNLLILDKIIYNPYYYYLEKHLYIFDHFESFRCSFFSFLSFFLNISDKCIKQLAMQLFALALFLLDKYIKQLAMLSI